MNQLPIYQCHKKVAAAKIITITGPNGFADGHAELVLDQYDQALRIPESGRLTIVVSPEWLRRNPKVAVGGYYVVYIENEDQYSAYSPAEPFEGGYAPVGESMDFGGAIRAMKEGKKVARAGWNGKGMFISFCPGSPALKAGQFWNPHNAEFARQNGGAAEVLPYISMKTADGKILMGWLASQTDMLANDWEVLDA